MQKNWVAIFNRKIGPLSSSIEKMNFDFGDPRNPVDVTF